jgi:hypothetical protein
MFKLPSLNEAINDPLGASVTVAALPYTAAYDIGSAAYNVLEQPLADAFGFESSSDSAARNAENARRAEAAARLKHYNDSLTADIDKATKSQIEALFTGGASSQVISEYLQNAKDGKGIFGVRRKQDNQVKAYKEAPGRGQSVFSTGAPTILGGGRGY